MRETPKHDLNFLKAYSLDELTLWSLHLTYDLQEHLSKAAKGNKAAAQRARKASILLTKVSKMWRKRSMQKEEKEIEESSELKKEAQENPKLSIWQTFMHKYF